MPPKPKGEPRKKDSLPAADEPEVGSQVSATTPLSPPPSPHPQADPTPPSMPAAAGRSLLDTCTVTDLVDEHGERIDLENVFDVSEHATSGRPLVDIYQRFTYPGTRVPATKLVFSRYQALPRTAIDALKARAAADSTENAS